MRLRCANPALVVIDGFFLVWANTAWSIGARF